MPRVRVILFREAGGFCPFTEWFDSLSVKARAKCVVRLRRLEQMGHELRRPEADFLRDGIHELRFRLGSVNHRVLYFFHDNVAAIVSHGIVKEDVVPVLEIDRAISRRKQFEADPTKHGYD